MSDWSNNNEEEKLPCQMYWVRIRSNRPFKLLYSATCKMRQAFFIIVTSVWHLYRFSYQWKKWDNNFYLLVYVFNRYTLERLSWLCKSGYYKNIYLLNYFFFINKCTLKRLSWLCKPWVISEFLPVKLRFFSLTNAPWKVCHVFVNLGIIYVIGP
jgi:hypothetical protein